MEVYIKLEYNTDLRFPDTSVKKITKTMWERFLAARKVTKSSELDAPFAFPGAADKDIPENQQNWHRRFTCYYRLDSKEYSTLIKKAKEEFKKNCNRGSIYDPRKWEDCLTIPRDYEIDSV